MRVSKYGDDARRQCEWLQQLPGRNRPSGIAISQAGCSYNFVEGRPPTSWAIVRASAYNAIWKQSGPMLDRDRPAYLDYSRQAMRDTMDQGYHPQIERALSYILVDYLHPVAACHGDLTFANCIQTRDDTIVFIDPGHHRGLPCEELDTAKILQSLDGFGVVYRGWAQPQAFPKMPTRRIHWVLLMTHYLRLLRHVTHEPSLKFARRRIVEISGLWA